MKKLTLDGNWICWKENDIHRSILAPEIIEITASSDLQTYVTFKISERPTLYSINHQQLRDILNEYHNQRLPPADKIPCIDSLWIGDHCRISRGNRIFHIVKLPQKIAWGRFSPNRDFASCILYGTVPGGAFKEVRLPTDCTYKLLNFSTDMSKLIVKQYVNLPDEEIAKHTFAILEINEK